MLRQENAGSVAFFGCIGNDLAGLSLVEAFNSEKILGVFARTDEDSTG